MRLYTILDHPMREYELITKGNQYFKLIVLKHIVISSSVGV